MAGMVSKLLRSSRNFTLLYVIPPLAVALCGACVLLMSACQNRLLAAPQEQDGSPGKASKPLNGNELSIETASLPETHPHARYEVRLQARGGVPPLRWKVESGELPQGIKLDDDGVLRGETEHAGDYRVVLSVRDNGSPAESAQKEFVIRVIEAMTLVWKTPAHVAGNRIEGSVAVSNTTEDHMRLTFYVLAVAENGRATAIGYQHFVLRPGVAEMELPFGDTLPRGAYLVHVDAVGEVTAKDEIYRRQLETPERLQVMVGP